ncbi:ATP-binding cassette domain-containing protein [Brevundimonas sp.]|uniref:ATP-binding cassette domain-containing protein n=1 Tax=Brevundimonas sp. TaxID=1871086 RepID=UPI002D42209A|nr:ATP-binding cassette domain-containing protein [Brevundimonas sp.]HYD26661.1 ATP-binding cassette domain-containing protein [Brevundimonas sp.]
MSAGVSLRELSVSLGGQPIVRRVSFDAPAAGWFGVLGVNGSGKTTLLRSLAGRLEAQGSIRIGDEELGRDRRARGRRIGFMPDQADLPALLTGADLVDLLTLSRGGEPALSREVHEALGLGALLDLRIGAMSSGMRQRLAVHSAFIGERPVLVLDEPFNWLDPIAAHDLRGLLRRAAEQGRTVITTLHDAAAFVLNCDEGVVLNEGGVMRRYEAGALPALRSDIAAFEADLYAGMTGPRRDRP